MLGFHKVLPIIVLMSKVDACPYLLRRQGKSDTHEANANRKLKAQGSNNFFYARFFSEADAAPFTTSAYNLIEASRPDGSYMDEDGRSSRGSLILPDGSTFTDFRLRGTPEAGLAGYSYLGQLLSHDLNLDLTSQLGVQVNPSTLPNSVSSLVDLDTIYGLESTGIDAQVSEGKFVFGNSISDQPIDFPRDTDGVALIADPRNDDNKILAQIAAVFMKLHNKLYDEYIASNPGKSTEQAFDFAKQETQRNWQSVVKYDLLPELVDTNVLADIMSPSYKNVLYTGGIKDSLGMPVEFSTGAWRLFHSRPASGYRLQNPGDRLLLFPREQATDTTLAGGQQLAAGEMINFNCFFNKVQGNTTLGEGVCGGTRNAQGGHILDMLYTSTLLKMAIGGPGTPPGTTVIDDDSIKYMLDGEAFQLPDGTVIADLATLDLARAQTHRVPGGLALANHVQSLGGDVDVITIQEMLTNPTMSAFGLPIEYYNTTNVPQDVPLLIYLAQESIKEHQGRRLGKLGTMIVGETVLTLIDEVELFNQGKGWESTVNDSDEVTFLEIANYVGWDASVDPQPASLFD